MQEVIKSAFDSARVAEMQLQLDDLLPRFCINIGDPHIDLAIYQANVYLGAFSISLAGWRCYATPLKLDLGAFHSLSFKKWGAHAALLAFYQFDFEQFYTRNTLPLVLHRVAALDVPELPEDSRAALHQFLEAAAHILD